MLEIFGNTLSTSKQKYAQSATEGSSRSQCVENIRSRHSFSDWDPQQAGNPYQWHAIDRAKLLALLAKCERRSLTLRHEISKCYTGRLQKKPTVFSSTFIKPSVVALIQL